jgi:hypothetical protein
VPSVVSQSREGAKLKSAEENHEHLEAYDLTGSLRDAGGLGAARLTPSRVTSASEDGAGQASAANRSSRCVSCGAGRPVEGEDRAAVAHDKITEMRFRSSERTIRRPFAQIKAAWHARAVAVHRPWIPGPVLWCCTTSGDGPVIGQAKTMLFACDWRGRGSGWCCRCWTRPGRTWPVRSMWRCTGQGLSGLSADR